MKEFVSYELCNYRTAGLVQFSQLVVISTLLRYGQKSKQIQTSINSKHNFFENLKSPLKVLSFRHQMISGGCFYSRVLARNKKNPEIQKGPMKSGCFDTSGSLLGGPANKLLFCINSFLNRSRGRIFKSDQFILENS